MPSRLDKHDYEFNEKKSRVARNQELYTKIYEDNSYFYSDDKPINIERTNEINIERVRELLRSRENYRKEIKMRELNIVKPKETAETEIAGSEEKKYDINDYLSKATSERDAEPYHKIDVDVVIEDSKIKNEKEETPAIEKTNLDVLQDMGNTELSLKMFENLQDESDNEDEVAEKETGNVIEDDTHEDTEKLDETADNTFFTDSIKIHISDQEEADEEGGTSLVVKIVIIVLILIIAALLAFLLFM